MREGDIPERILTVNAGSSSVRLSVWSARDLAAGQLASVRHEVNAGTPRELLDRFLMSQPQARWLVAHRIVHGGSRLTAPCAIDAVVEREIERVAPLAPLHNPAALMWLRCCRAALGDRARHVAVFDSGFHASMPELARSYALPEELCAAHEIRRYGFHGIAHQALWRRWCELRPDLSAGGRLITLQLGAGCSITAITEGQVSDTSMGFSPLEGLVMATRSGDIDARVITHLQRSAGLSADDVEALLFHRSGLLGVSGISGDMRELLASQEPRARLAIDLYCHRARKYLGAYLAVLGGADGIAFGGGVGEHAAPVRAAILAGMEWAGIVLDDDANSKVSGREGRISNRRSAVDVRVIPVDESRVMAQLALEYGGSIHCWPISSASAHQDNKVEP